MFLRRPQSPRLRGGFSVALRWLSYRMRVASRWLSVGLLHSHYLCATSLLHRHRCLAGGVELALASLALLQPSQKAVFCIKVAGFRLSQRQWHLCGSMSVSSTPAKPCDPFTLKPAIPLPQTPTLSAFLLRSPRRCFAPLCPAIGCWIFDVRGTGVCGQQAEETLGSALSRSRRRVRMLPMMGMVSSAVRSRSHTNPKWGDVQTCTITC